MTVVYVPCSLASGLSLLSSLQVMKGTLDPKWMEVFALDASDGTHLFVRSEF